MTISETSGTTSNFNRHLQRHHPARCISDETVRQLSAKDQLSKHYQVPVFKFIGSDNREVYLHCRVLVCGEGESRCTQGCRRRLRRDLWTEQHQEQRTLTGGPVLILPDP